MDILELQCPHCGAVIDVNEDAAAFDCPHCGSRIILEGPGNIDLKDSLPNNTSPIQYAQVSKKKSPLYSITITVIVLAIIAGSGLFAQKWYFENERIPIPFSEKDAVGKNCESIKDDLESAGFTNIELVPETENSSKKHQTVKEIKILDDNKYMNDFKKNTVFKRAARITIYYYDSSENDRIYLEKNINDIQTLIEKGDRDGAESRIKKYTPPESVKDEWADQKNELIIQLESLKPVPFSSSEALEKTYSEVADMLRDAGFNEITEEPSHEKSFGQKTLPVFFKTEAGKVQRIKIIDGEREITDFKKGDYFNESAEITITYYDNAE